jgi:hypothetical protein
MRRRRSSHTTAAAPGVKDEKRHEEDKHEDLREADRASERGVDDDEQQ